MSLIKYEPGMTFDPIDPYLPLGDVIVPVDADISKIYCILYRND
jgi:hypothetical protein